MKFADLSPSPSLKDQVDAFQKGLGSAMQWAVAGKLDDEPLLQACLHDQRYDMQCETPRGSAVPIKEFTVLYNGNKISYLEAPHTIENIDKVKEAADDPEKREMLVRVKWERPFQKMTLIGKRACSPIHPRLASSEIASRSNYHLSILG